MHDLVSCRAVVAGPCAWFAGNNCMPGSFLVNWLGMLSKLSGGRREGVAPARAILYPVGIPQVHWTALLAVMQDVALLSFGVFLLN